MTNLLFAAVLDDLLTLTITYLPIFVSVLALVVTLVNNAKSHSKSTYFELDNQYSHLLQIALDNPDLRDFSKTSNYINEDPSSVFYIRYNLYAYMVWNFLETIFDQSGGNTKKNNIKFNTWLPVIKEENKIHYRWFKHNIQLFKPAFSDFVINELNDLQIRKAMPTELDLILPYYEAQFPEEERKNRDQLLRLLQQESYYLYIATHSFLPSNQNIIGYAMVFVDHQNKGIWLDYLAIVPGFQSAGYGTALFGKIVDDLGAGDYTTFLEAEIPGNSQPNSPENKRIRFYKKLNCHRLPFKYLLPTPESSEELYLLCRPKDIGGVIFKSNIQAIISKVQSTVHSDIPHVKDIITQNLGSVKDDFHY